MSEVITKGYLINREDYDTFDEILTFYNEHNVKFTCYSRGSKKINSKNARNIDYGNYLEFELFYSSTKLSRLKKVTSINELDIQHKKKISLLLLNEFIYKYNLENDKIYDFYQMCIFYMNAKINDYLLILYIIINFYKISGLTINFNHCCKCNDKLNLINIDFNNSSMICRNCNENKIISQSLIDFIKEVFINKKYNISLFKDFDIKELRIVIYQMISYLYDTSGIFLSTIKKNI